MYKLSKNMTVVKQKTYPKLTCKELKYFSELDTFTDYTR